MSCPGRSDSRRRPSPWQAADVVEPCGSAFKRLSNTPTPKARKAVLLCVASRQTAACAAHLSHDHSQHSLRCTTAGTDRPPLLRGRSGSKSHGQGDGSAQARAGHPPQGACCRSSPWKTPAIDPSTRRLRCSFGVMEETAGPRRPRPPRSSVQPAVILRTHAEPSASMGRLPCPALSASPTFARTTVRHDRWAVLMERTA